MYHGKKVSALVQWHESALLTSEIFVEILQPLDEMTLIPPLQSDAKPLILILVGHRSRLEMPFLKYVNTPNGHWIACIGVPFRFEVLTIIRSRKM